MIDEKKERPVERIVKTTMFAMVALVVITSVALPIFATIGTTTVTLSNDGPGMSYVNEKYADLWGTYDTDTAEIKCNTTGLYLSGEISGVRQETMLLSSDRYVKDIPLILIVTSGYTGYILTYTGNQIAFSSLYAPNGPQNNVSQFILDVFEDDDIYVQDPDGRLHLEKDEGYYSELSEVLGFSYGLDRFMQVDGSTAKLRTDVLRTGTADVGYDEIGGGYRVTGAEYGGYDCQYYLCPDFKTAEEKDLLGSGPVRNMIGMIPVLIMIGAILMVVKRTGMSDR